MHRFLESRSLFLLGCGRHQRQRNAGIGSFVKHTSTLSRTSSQQEVVRPSSTVERSLRPRGSFPRGAMSAAGLTLSLGEHLELPPEREPPAVSRSGGTDKPASSTAALAGTKNSGGTSSNGSGGSKSSSTGSDTPFAGAPGGAGSTGSASGGSAGKGAGMMSGQQHNETARARAREDISFPSLDLFVPSGGAKAEGDSSSSPSCDGGHLLRLNYARSTHPPVVYLTRMPYRLVPWRSPSPSSGDPSSAPSSSSTKKSPQQQELRRAEINTDLGLRSTVRFAGSHIAQLLTLLNPLPLRPSADTNTDTGTTCTTTGAPPPPEYGTYQLISDRYFTLNATAVIMSCDEKTPAAGLHFHSAFGARLAGTDLRRRNLGLSLSGEVWTESLERVCHWGSALAQKRGGPNSDGEDQSSGTSAQRRESTAVNVAAGTTAVGGAQVVNLESISINDPTQLLCLTQFLEDCLQLTFQFDNGYVQHQRQQQPQPRYK